MKLLKLIAITLCAYAPCALNAGTIDFSLKANESLPIKIKSIVIDGCEISSENPQMQCSVSDKANLIDIKLSNDLNYGIKIDLSTIKAVNVTMQEDGLINVQMQSKEGHTINQNVKTN